MKQRLRIVLSEEEVRQALASFVASHGVIFPRDANIWLAGSKVLFHDDEGTKTESAVLISWEEETTDAQLGEGAA